MVGCQHLILGGSLLKNEIQLKFIITFLSLKKELLIMKNNKEDLKDLILEYRTVPSTKLN